MEESSSSSTLRFRFRDHQQQPQMADGDGDDHTSPDTWSISSDGDDEVEIESMTGKGIKHLCSELLELKRISDEDFHKNIFSNYSAFLRIFKELEGMEKELMQLKQHVSTQKRLVKELVDGICLKVLSNETVDLIIEEPIRVEPSPQSILESHADDVSEALDILLSERRLDEALAILELEDGVFQGMQLQEKFPLNVLTYYNSAISERRAKIADQLKLVAGNPRVSAPELLKALVGLCRLGDSHPATQLLVKYYHSRIASGICDLQHSKSGNGSFIHEVAKLVFSMISQAAMSFLVLYGETSSYSSEFMQWACEETELFAASFNKYVRSISEISGGLVTIVEAVQSALSYCSLLETQKVVLHPCLVKHIRPCVEDVLQIHIDHFKKVIQIFTSTDAWVVDKYLLSGILSEGCSSVVIGQQPEYCLLTNSGRKFVTLLQVYLAITKDISPLVAFQMEAVILKGLMALFTEYLAILESVLTGKAHGLERGGRGGNSAESLEQQVSVVANLSTLVRLFSSIIKSVFKGINHLDFEVHNFMLYIQEASDRIRAHFCQQFICKIMYGSGCRLSQETWVGGQRDSDTSEDMMPSVVFQGVFLELRKLEKLAEGNFVEVDGLPELMRELIEAIFISISNNEELWTTTKEDLAVQRCENFKQFVLDMQFLVEIAREGGYFTNNILTASLALISHMESIFLSAGLDPRRDMIDEGWAINSAKEALQKLREIKETKPSPKETTGYLEEKTKDDQPGYASDSFEIDDTTSSSENFVESAEPVVINVSEVVFSAGTEILKIEDVEADGGFESDDRSAVNPSNVIITSEDVEPETAVDAMTKIRQKIRKTKSSSKELLSDGNGRKTSSEWSPKEEDETSSQLE
ncbi:hypothetical protein HYC85_031379 [Camellia sinensis]|uniref:Exocyst component Exo84 C-terminal domain-containing protein n=1 Tax=Camellia sinensis TaxID=4442 RepID=A0A7J7FU08_CAMSI|nr:hypothetical protein HYC85_031379 [Camellia sinensis]